ncbi:hypothetical protein RQP46_004518 [Phenoliferia psychrophenolica]
MLHSDRAERPVFRYRILPNHSHSITEVVLHNEADLKGLEYTLSILPLLSSLRAIHLSQAAARALLWVDVDDPAADNPLPACDSGLTEFHLSTLNSISKSIRVLSLLNFEAAYTPALILKFPNLEKLCFIGLARSAEMKTVEELDKALAPLHRLTHLTIDLADDAGWPPCALEALAAADPPPPVKVLILRNFWQDDNLIRIITQFHATLEILELELSGQASFTLVAPLDLPKLSTLHLHFESDREGKNLLSPFEDVPIKEISYNRAFGKPESFHNDLADFVSSWPGALTEVVGHTLEFGRNELARAVAEGDVEKLKRMGAKLRELEEMRWDWLD